MKAEELRIGNWVNDLIESRIVKIDGIEPNHDEVWVNYANGSGQYKRYINNISPIPLSEEVLLRCGFEKCEKHENFYFIKLNDWTKIYVAFHEKQYAVELSVSKHSFCPKVKHLHQLQNLYYALTGQELEVSL